jgi:hypothetical protein
VTPTRSAAIVSSGSCNGGHSQGAQAESDECPQEPGASPRLQSVIHVFPPPKAASARLDEAPPPSAALAPRKYQTT